MEKMCDGMINMSIEKQFFGSDTKFCKEKLPMKLVTRMFKAISIICLLKWLKDFSMMY